MTELWLIYFLAFASGFLAVQFIYGLVVRDLRSRRRIVQRFATVDSRLGAGRQLDVIKQRGQRRPDLPGPLASLDTLIVQSGIRLSRPILAAIVIGLAIALVLVLPSSIPFIARLPLAALTAVVGLVLVLKLKRARRIAKFSEQLPDAIDIMVRSLRAGHPLPVSLSLVAREMADPAGSEFALAFDEITYGRDIRQALENLYERVGYDDLKFLVTSIAITTQTGGNLGEILLRLSRLIRDRFRLKRKVRSLSAEGRFSALALSIFPFALFGAINLLSPAFYAEVWGHPVLMLALVVAGGLLAVGNVVMYKIVNFKV